MDILLLIVRPIAQVLDVTAETVIVVLAGLGLLVVAWTVLRPILKIATKVFTAGCLVLVLLGIAAFIGMAILGAATPGTITF